MNRSKIEWCDHTWNPITGCKRQCNDCYARKMTVRFSGDIRMNLMAKEDYITQPARDGSGDVYSLDKAMLNETGKSLVYPFGFAPTLHRYRMDYPKKLKMGNNIFVGAMSDIFGTWVPDAWIKEVIKACKDTPIHNYLFLTKNPERYLELEKAGILPFTNNFWYGASITKVEQVGRVAKVFSELSLRYHTFLSIDPILEDITKVQVWQDALLEIEWIIIGTQAKRKKEKVIPQEWIEHIVLDANVKKVPIFMQNSLLSIIGEKNLCREFPEQLQQLELSPKMKKKLFGICAKCKCYQKKSDMITLLARSKRGDQPKQYGFMCKDCFKKECQALQLDMPKLANLS